MSKTKAFLDYIKKTKSINTFRLYERGLRLFEEFYGKSSDVAIEERREDIASGDFERNKRFTRLIEEFHARLRKQDYAINSARAMTLGIIQLFRHYGMPITIERASEVSKTVITTKDFVPTIEQYRSAFNVADLQSRVIMSMGLDLAWRIGDVMTLRKDMLLDLNQPTPIPFDLRTQKEDILAKSFLSAETVELLKTYLATLPQENPYLFPSNGDGHLLGEAINYKLKEAFKKAKIEIPKGKNLRYHAFRKRFLSECANLKIDINTAKILCGKSVEKSMLTYLSEVEHKNAFLEVKEKLSLTKVSIKPMSVETSELERKIERLERIIAGVVALGGSDFIKKAEQIIETQFTGTMRMKGLKVITEKPSILEVLELIGKAQEEKQRKEYEKLIEENNNNH
jgi:integrase